MQPDAPPTRWLRRETLHAPPPPMPGMRYVRVPFRGVMVADDDLRRAIDRFFHLPMIALALAILPLLAWELLWPPPSGTWLWWVSAISLGVIWLAFLVEFIIKIAIAESRVEYVRRNWLDVVVLCLPALRPLRVGAVVRTSRVFALRGVGMKFLRYAVTIVIGLEATDRYLARVGVRRRRDGRPDPNEMTRLALMDEVRRLRRRNEAWERWYREHKAFIDATRREGDAGEFGEAAESAERSGGACLSQRQLEDNAGEFGESAESGRSQVPAPGNEPRGIRGSASGPGDGSALAAGGAPASGVAPALDPAPGGGNGNPAHSESSPAESGDGAGQAAFPPPPPVEDIVEDGER